MDKDKVKLAIAPIGWTNDDMPELGKENSFQQIVSEMALAGFTGSEVGSKYPRDPAVLKPMLDIRGIEIVNAWFSTYFANGDREKRWMNLSIIAIFCMRWGLKLSAVPSRA
ncbi:inosose dehydratase [Erwinia amylovora MR1]|nr:inosose dehydratase [Erwinia amylovora MR1]